MKEIVYNTIGVGYNDTRQADPFLLEQLIHLLEAEKGKTYLDIGCGTGNYTIAISEKGFNITGVEPSERMLNIAQKRSDKIHWILGQAEKLPFDNEIFDGIVATLTIHHWQNLSKAFSEIVRVLKKDGRVVIFTSIPEQMEGYWLNAYFPKMLSDSIKQMPNINAIETACKNAKLEITKLVKYDVKDDLKDHFLYVGKNRPKLYFDELIRGGISSFALLSNLDEVTEGLSKLHVDIENGNFEIIKKQFENNYGDYCFLVVQNAKEGILSL